MRSACQDLFICKLLMLGVFLSFLSAHEMFIPKSSGAYCQGSRVGLVKYGIYLWDFTFNPFLKIGIINFL